MNETRDIDLTALTPPELDERFVAAWDRIAQARTAYDYFKAQVAEGKTYYDYEARANDEYEKLVEAQNDQAVLDAEWERRGGWSRYWLVTNLDGHVHRDTSCSTTYPTTQWALVTGLSGLTENEMVEQVGHRACTVCYPDAPVHPKYRATLAEAEAAERAKRDALCPGSGQSAHATWRDRFVTCHVCGRSGVPVTRGGRLRQHKTPETERAENAAAAAADPKKIVAPDGSPLRARYGEVKTVVSAWRELVDALDFLDATNDQPDNRYRAEHQEVADAMVAALAAKFGQTADEVLAQGSEKLAARRKREGRQ